MENRKIPALLALAGVVIAVAVFLFVANDDTADQPSETTQAETTPAAEDEPADKPEKDAPAEPEEAAEPQVPVIEIEAGEPVGGVAEFEVTEGDNIKFIVRSDAAHEIHLHTYDVAM